MRPARFLSDWRPLAVRASSVPASLEPAAALRDARKVMMKLRDFRDRVVLPPATVRCPAFQGTVGILDARGREQAAARARKEARTSIQRRERRIV
jgi:hypothetical protein